MGPRSLMGFQWVPRGLPITPVTWEVIGAVNNGTDTHKTRYRQTLGWKEGFHLKGKSDRRELTTLQPRMAIFTFLFLVISLFLSLQGLLHLIHLTGVLVSDVGLFYTHAQRPEMGGNGWNRDEKREVLRVWMDQANIFLPECLWSFPFFFRFKAYYTWNTSQEYWLMI